MANYKYYTIFFNIDSEEYTEQEKLHAIKNVIGMVTHNGVNKQSIINAFRWMYNYAFEEATRPQTNADRIRAMSDEKLAEFIDNYRPEHIANDWCLSLCPDRKDGDCDCPYGGYETALGWLKSEVKE